MRLPVIFLAATRLLAIALFVLIQFAAFAGPECTIHYRRFWLRETYKEQIQFLQTHFHGQSFATIEKRVANSHNSLKFLRTFVPIYRDMLSRSGAHTERFRVFQKFEGVINGDPHLENFAVMLDRHGKAGIYLADVDDMARGPLYLDFLRLATSVEMRRGKIPMGRMKEAYLAGLRGSRWEYSELTQDMIRQSERSGFRLKSSDITRAGNLKRREPAVEISQAIRSKIDQSIAAVYGPNAKVKDAYEHIREMGGSAYFKRYEVLVERGGDKLVLEYKELPGRTVAEVDELIDTTFGPRRDPLMRGGEVDGKVFMIRPRYESKQSFDFSVLDNAQTKEALEDEAYALGLYHRKHNDSKTIERYIKAVDNSDRELWENEAQALDEEFSAIYEALR